MKIVLQILIVLIAAIAIYGSTSLVMNEWETGNICPKIISIPACYIVLLCFGIALLAHITKGGKSLWVYFFFVGIVTLIAIIGTIGELTGWTQCPRTPSGTPMCFISLTICLSLLFLKIALLKLPKH